MIHEAYMPVYMGSRFLARDGRDGTGRTEVVQEALADLKIPIRSHHLPNIIVFRNVTLNTKEKVWRCKKGDVGADYEGLSWRHYPDG